MKKIIISLLFFYGIVFQSIAQDDLLKELEKTGKPEIVFTTATFKGTRLVTGHTIETVSKKHLDFIISHRFGAINEGSYGLWGLDQAQIRFGLEYGINNRLTVGVGRSSYQKTYDYFLKYRLLRQSSGARIMPVSVTLFASDATNTTNTREDPENPNLKYYNNTQRQTYTAQILVARKLSDRLSLQLAPTFIHRNLTNYPDEANNLYTLGMGGRFKLTRRVSFNAEYWYTQANHKEEGGTVIMRDPRYTNALSLGFDIETGGHVFQLHFTNSRGMIEKQFIGQTTGKWGAGDIFYGFNIARRFSFEKGASKTTK